MEAPHDKKQEARLPNIWFAVSIFILSIVGILDTTYLTIKRYSHDEINCSIFDGCDFVTTSNYSQILGVPVAVLGVIFYVSIFTLSLLYLRSKSRGFITSLFGLSLVGFLMSIWFFYTQAFVLNAFCLYCLVSARLSTALFILSSILMIKSSKVVPRGGMEQSGMTEEVRP